MAGHRRLLSTRNLGSGALAVVGALATGAVAAATAQATVIGGGGGSVKYYPERCTPPAQTEYPAYSGPFRGTIYNSEYAGAGCNGGTGLADPCGQFLVSREGHTSKRAGLILCGDSYGGGWHSSVGTIGVSPLSQYSSAWPGARVCKYCRVDAFHSHYLEGVRTGGTQT